MRPVTRDQQLAYLTGQLSALALDLRQAKANDDMAEIAILEMRRDELLDWRNRLTPPREA